MAKAETEKPNSHCQERVSLYSFLHPTAKIPQQQQICLCTTESSCTADTVQLGTGHRKSSTWGSRIHLPHRRDLQSWSFIYSLRLWRHLWRTASSGIKATSTLLTRPWRRRPASGRLSWWGWGRDTSGRAEGSARRPRTARRACRTAGLRRAQRWLLQRHPPDPARHPSLALPQPRASPLSSSMRAELASSSCSPYPASARNDFPPAAIANPATAHRARAAALPPHRPSGACALLRARQQPRRPPFPATGRGWAPAGTPPLLRRPIRAERGRCGAHRSSNEGAEMRLAGRSVAGVWCATPVRGLLAMLCRALLLRAAGHREYREYCAPGAAVQGARTAVGSGVCGPLALRLPDRGVRCSPGPLVSFQVSPHRFPCSISWMAIGAVGKMITSPTEKLECPSRPSAAAFLRVRPHAWDTAERGSRCKLVSAECFKICWRGSALVWAGNRECAPPPPTCWVLETFRADRWCAVPWLCHEVITELQAVPNCKGPIRITESKPWLHSGPPNNQTVDAFLQGSFLLPHLTSQESTWKTSKGIGHKDGGQELSPMPVKEGTVLGVAPWPTLFPIYSSCRVERLERNAWQYFCVLRMEIAV